MTRTVFALGTLLILTACASTPEPVSSPVVINTEPLRTCYPISELKRVVIPAETKTYTVVSLIENPPYDPIEREEQFTRVVQEEQVYYVDDTGAQVTDICDEADSGT